MPLISAVITTYNYADRVGEAIESALHQTFQDLEVVVIDDGSTDATREVCARFESRIRYVYQENRGVPAARNRGLAESHGELIAFLDADDLWYPTKLEAQVELLASQPALGLVYGMVEVVGTGGEVLRVTGEDVNATGLLLKSLLFGNQVSMSTVMVRRGCLEQVGPFEEKAIDGCEDWDLWLRLALEGNQFAFIPQPMAQYRLHMGQDHRNVARIYRNTLSVLDRTFAHPKMPPGMRGLKKQAYSHHLLVASRRFYNAGQVGKARSCALRALALYPRHASRGSIALVVKSLLGGRGVSIARAAKRSLAARASSRGSEAA